MTPHLFLHVQHLLGIGHMERAFAIAGASHACGFKVTVATGRRSCTPDLPFDWVALPDLRSADASFSKLLDEDGNPASDALWAERRKALIQGFTSADPGLLLVEGFPFARRRFRHELLPLLDEAKKRGIPSVCSIRDILQPKTAEDRIAECLTWANKLFDLILVHGDPVIARLEDSFPAVGQLETPVVYTGYVSKPDGPDDGETGREEIIVSAGGGAVGTGLYKAALEAACLPGGDKWRWRILVGRNMSAEMTVPVPAHVIVEPARPDFRALLSRAAVSISQAGYNTAVDLFASAAPAVLVPFADGGQKEQAMRSAKLAAVLGASVLPENELTGKALLETVGMQAGRKSGMAKVDLTGAERTARLLSVCRTQGADAAAGLGLKTEDGNSQ